MARKIITIGDIAKVPLTKGYEAIIDADMAEVVGRYSWWANETSSGKVYAARTERKSTVLMHREIVGAARGEETDHADGDGLNNRRANLRPATHQENMRNRDGWGPLPKGVTAYGEGFAVMIGLDGVQYQVGRLYETPEEAADVYRLFARAIHGEFYRGS